MKKQGRVVLSSTTFDPKNKFVGSSPVLGDVSSIGIIIPPDPTIDQSHRYLIRLCAMRLGPNVKAIIRSIRQYVTIGAQVSLDNDKFYLYEKQIKNPSWSFVDGNISWHLKKRAPTEYAKGGPYNAVPAPSFIGQPSGYSPDIRNISSAIIYKQLPTSVNPFSGGYQPFNAGIPPGDSIAGFGNFKDLRFPWREFSDIDDNGYEVNGPGDICFYASVQQTNPRARQNPPALPDGVVPYWLSEEDQFVYNYPSLARYYRIAGELIIDLYEHSSCK